jgi:hypothetical protein
MSSYPSYNCRLAIEGIRLENDSEHAFPVHCCWGKKTSSAVQQKESRLTILSVRSATLGRGGRQAPAVVSGAPLRDTQNHWRGDELRYSQNFA